MKKQGIELRPIKQTDLQKLWEIGFKENDASWKRWDGPYFQKKTFTKAIFMAEKELEWVDNPNRFVIMCDDEIIGTISAYWLDPELQKWLEFGLCIYTDKYWGRGVGAIACSMWLDYLFESHSELRRIGFTTWSGNKRMIKLGERLGMTCEATVRQVRFFEGEWYDSIKYGVLATEWQESRN